MTKAVKLEPEFDPSKYIDPEEEGGLIADKMQLQEDKKKEEELFAQKVAYEIYNELVLILFFSIIPDSMISALLQLKITQSVELFGRN